MTVFLLTVLFGCFGDYPKSGPDGKCLSFAYQYDHDDPDCPCTDKVKVVGDFFKSAECRSDQTMTVEKLDLSATNIEGDRAVAIVRCACKTETGR